MKKLFEDLLDWIYKKKCYFCGSSKECVAMCSGCYEQMDFLPQEINRQIADLKIYCAGDYGKTLQKLIRGLKYHGKKDLAFFLAKFMTEYSENIFKDKTFQIVPVPLYPERRKQRKYNHMKLVADELSRLTGWKVNDELVERVKNTRPQYKLRRAARLENLKDAFIIHKDKLLDGEVLLLDDLCTTGATFESIATELYKSEIFDITCFAAATPV